MVSKRQSVVWIIALPQYYLVVAVWRAKEAYSKNDYRPVALRIELVHKVDDHLILMRLTKDESLGM